MTPDVHMHACCTFCQSKSSIKEDSPLSVIFKKKMLEKPLKHVQLKLDSYPKNCVT